MKNLIVLSLIITAATACRSDKTKADEAVQEYMHSVPGATRAECTDSDTDHDGYCSCTIFRGSGDPLPVQCGCERFCVFNCARGCKYTPFAGGGRR